MCIAYTCILTDRRSARYIALQPIKCTIYMSMEFCVLLCICAWIACFTLLSAQWVCARVYLCVVFLFIRFFLFCIFIYLYVQAKEANKRFFFQSIPQLFLLPAAAAAVTILCCCWMHRLNFNGAIIKLRFIVACNHVKNGNQAK